MTQNKKQSTKGNTSLIEELRELWTYLPKNRQGQMFLLLVLMLLSSLGEMVSVGSIFPFLSAFNNPEKILADRKLKPIFDFFSIETSIELITVLAIGFIVTVIIANGIRLITVHFRIRFASAVGADISNQIYNKTLKQSYTFHVSQNSSNLIQTVTIDTDSLTQSVLIPLVALINNALIIPALIATFIFIDGTIALGAAIVLGGAYLVIYKTRRKLLARNSKVITQAGEKKIKVVQEGIGGIRDILLSHNQEFFEKVYQKSEYALKRAKATNNIISQSPKFFIEVLALSAIALLALSLGKDGDFSRVVPILGSLALGAKKLLPTLQEAFNSLAKIQGSKASITRVLIALRRRVNNDLMISAIQSLNRLPLEKELRLNQIWFRYTEDTDWVLKNLNLTIEAKTTVAFIGSTGSGKSTTADLILGLLQPQKGDILVDNLPLKGERLYQWQKNIAHVPQSIFLCDGTIAENIAFGVPYEQINLQQVQKAAKLAQIADFIESLPAQYNTYVGERGIRLSGGQRQRIGIARALYGDASVIVFDEATSALDNATEKEVMKAIESLSHNFTIIMIAHRLSTVEKCDRIFELSNGQVIYEGNYKELLECSPSFRKMAAAF
ncbi:ABC transporter ATP-binding protein [Cyanobacterium aponinum UTEX 3222]|uniref:ABC transporter ATP-binding protein n=1 Tax=Cyanobacterium aponinum TaxID=379064 RepID=UPI003089C4FA|nr:ABC transporter ATP-binding protein [Cyanobacterium aponinum UTEX 3222]